MILAITFEEALGNVVIIFGSLAVIYFVLGLVLVTLSARK